MRTHGSGTYRSGRTRWVVKAVIGALLLSVIVPFGAGPAYAGPLSIRIGLAWERWAVECGGQPTRGLTALVLPGGLWPARAGNPDAPPAAPTGTYRLSSGAPATAVVAAESPELVQAAAAALVRWSRFAQSAADAGNYPALAEPLEPLVAKQGALWYCLAATRLDDAAHDQRAARTLTRGEWPNVAVVWPAAPGRPDATEAQTLLAVAQGGPLSGLLYRAAAPVSFTAPMSAAHVEHNARPYRGRLEIVQAGAARRLSVVNHVDIEDYLLGVVPSEMPASWPLEALKAQAVAARTYAASNLGRHSGSGFDLCFDIHCQAYNGVPVEHASTTTAVRATAGVVATYGGRLINAVYHAHAGGATDSSQVIWGAAEPYLVGTTRTYEQPYYWTATNSRQEVEAVIRAALDSVPEGLMPLLRLVPRSFTAGGRATRVDVLGAQVTAQITANRLRNALGTYRLRSGAFTASPVWVASAWETWPGHGGLGEALPLVSWVPGARGIGVLVWQQEVAASVPESRLEAGSAARDLALGAAWIEPAFQVFSGEGFGHGVGMSQWGAREMAALGHGYQAILRNYYRGVALTPSYGR